ARLASFTAPSVALLPEEVGPALSAWVAKMLAPMPSLRFASAREALNGLERARLPASPAEVVAFLEEHFKALLDGAKAAASAATAEGRARLNEAGPVVRGTIPDASSLVASPPSRSRL